MEIIPDKRKLVGLIEQAHAGKLCLPNFQRDFVWTRDEVADLVRSILRRYFVGSLLLLRCDPQEPPFDPVALRGAEPTHTKPQPDWLVLDGQQRLTSLLYALTAPDLGLKNSVKRRWFFVDLDRLLTDPDDDEIVFDRAKRELDGLDTLEAQYERRILPCARLLRSQDFLTWRDGFDDWLREWDPDGHKQFRNEWRDPWTHAVTEFQTFEVPLIELPAVVEGDSDAIGRVCAIFEKLNSTGVELSVYDLLTARLYRSGIRLHDLWDEACKKNKLLREWSDGKADHHKFGVLVLRTLALLRGLDPKPRILIDLAPDSFDEDWRRAAAAIERALELIVHVGADGFGVFDKKWLPGFGLVPILAALRAVIDDKGLSADAYKDLRRWYWCNVFLERYSSAVESKSRKDFAEFVGYWTEDKGEPAVFAEARARIGAEGYSVRDSASFASAVYSGVFCLLALRGARDWRVEEAIALQKLDDHHVFPQSYLRKRGVTERMAVNSIVNRTLISDQTNKLISDDAPATYLEDRAVFASEDVGEVLTAHFLDGGPLVAMRDAAEDLTNEQAKRVYEQFRAAREELIVREIRRVCEVG